MTTEREVFERLIRKRVELTEPQIRVLADHFSEIRRMILKGTPHDTLIREIDKFLVEFGANFKSLENKLQMKDRQNWYSEKLRSQLDMF